jgi:hypothetical protein
MLTYNFLFIYLATTPNLCRLHRLVYPKKDGGKFVMEEIKQYKNEA